LSLPDKPKLKKIKIKKLHVFCFVVIILAITAANIRRFFPDDPHAYLAAEIYKGLLEDIEIVGMNFTSLTTTLGSYPVKKVSEDPAIAALMVRLLKDAGISAGSDSVVAINASGSFPGFTLAALSACAAMEIRTYVIASIGSSTYGANVPGNTIADMLLNENVKDLGHTLLAISPGGSSDRGRELDEEELDRIEEMLGIHGITFFRPQSLIDAIDFRISIFSDAGSSLLINIGGNHASSGANNDLDLLAGVLLPENFSSFNDHGLIQNFLGRNLPAIQILNIRLLLASFGLSYDQAGNILGNTDNLFRERRQ